MEQAFSQASNFHFCFFSSPFAAKLFTRFHLCRTTRKRFDLPPIRWHFHPASWSMQSKVIRIHSWRSWNQSTRRKYIVALSNAAPFGQRFQWRRTTKSKIFNFFGHPRNLCSIHSHTHTHASPNYQKVYFSFSLSSSLLLQSFTLQLLLFHFVFKFRVLEHNKKANEEEKTNEQKKKIPRVRLRRIEGGVCCSGCC